MLTMQSLYLLHLLKKAQGAEDNTVLIFPPQMNAGVVIHEGQRRKTPIVSLSKYAANYHSCLDFLSKQGYIDFSVTGDKNDSPIQVTVKHEGWHTLQTTFWKVCSFLFRSVAVPIAVAFITSLITITAIRIL